MAALNEQEEFEFRRRFEQEQAAAAKQPPTPTTRQRFMASMPARVWQGMRDPIDAAAQLLPRGLEFVSSAGGLAPNPVSEFFGSEALRVDQGINQAAREYESARRATGQEGADVARFAGNVISPVNLAIAAKAPALATTGQRILGGFGLGAAGGALQPVNTEENPDFGPTKAGQMLLGGATGAVMTPIAGKVGDFVGRKLAEVSAARSPQTLITLKQTTEEFARASGLDWDNMSGQQQQDLFDLVQKAAADYAGKDPKVMARIADFKSLGMPYTLGQVTRDPLQFASEKNLSQLAGTGDPLSARFQTQGAMLQQRLGSLAAGAGEQQQAGQRLVGALQKIDADLSDEVSKAYNLARQSAGKEAEVPLQGLAQDFAAVLNDFGDKVPSGVRNNFAQYGIGNADNSMTQRKLFTVESADKLLKVINANQSNDPATNAALSALRGAVKRAVTQDAGLDDVFAPARRLAAQRFALQDAVPALEASANGTVNPDTFVQNFIVNPSASTPKVKELARLLRENDPAAFLEAKSQLGAYLRRQAFGENVTGDKGFSPERFASALRNLGTDKLSAFFTPQEVKQLQTISRVGSYMDAVPYASRPNTSGNWGAITQLATSIPGAPQSAALVNALRNSVSNELNVRRALSANPPTQLTPEQIRLLSQFLGAGSLAAGAAGSPDVQ